MRELKKLSWAESIHEAIAKNRKKDGVNGVATLQCEVLDSSRCGQMTALIYGPGCTYKTPEQMNEHPGGVYVTGLPSSASFAVNYTEDVPSNPKG